MTDDVIRLLDSRRDKCSSTFGMLKALAMRSLRGRDIGSYEAVAKLQSDVHFKGQSDPIQGLLVGLPQFRRRRLLKDKMEELKKTDDDEITLFYANWIDDYYPARPADLEEWSLHRLFQQHDYSKQKPIDNEKRRVYELLYNSGWLRSRPKPKLVRTPPMNLNTKDAERLENCFFIMLQLFVPYRFVFLICTFIDSYQF